MDVFQWKHYVDYFVSEPTTIIYFHGAGSNGDKGVNPDIGIIPVKKKKQYQEDPVTPCEYKLPLVWIDLEMTGKLVE